MKKNLWLFGDSFTDYNYKNVPAEFSEDITQWGDIVGKQMGLNVHNFGQGGFSNQQIISEILDKLHLIKENDYVSIGLSTPYRVLTVRNGFIRSFLPNHYLNSKSQEGKRVFDYVQNTVYPNEKLFEEFYWSQIRGIEKVLSKMNCKTFTWDWRLWEKFESIKSQSKGKDKNNHWSKKGHQDMAKLVIQKFTNTTNTVI